MTSRIAAGLILGSALLFWAPEMAIGSTLVDLPFVSLILIGRGARRLARSFQ